MTDRSLTPGSGARLRRAYTRYLLIATAGLSIVLVLAVGAARAAADGDTVLIVIVGVAATVAASLLLIGALLRGRAAIIADTLSIPAMRSSAVLALAAQVAGCAGIVAALTLGFLQQLSDVGLALTTGLAMAVCSAAPTVLSGAARRMSRRLTT